MDLVVQRIKSFECREWLLRKHYARRVPSISYAFGLYDENVLRGVLTIGKPASPFLCVGICGEQHADFVFELNRLVVEDGLPKNALSFFVGRSLRLINDSMILVSYADTAYGHHGYIYQATNWIYTGKTKPMKDRQIIGSVTHARHNNTYEQEGEWEVVERSIKHRYVYFLGKSKKAFRNALRYQPQPYPKGDNHRYDASYRPVTQPLLGMDL